jgi:selenium metabolism protein YedF
MKTIDCRGQSCPAPVIATKKALEESIEGIYVLVDDGAPRENVRRFAHNRGYQIIETADGNNWTITISQGATTDATTPLPLRAVPPTGGRVLLITADILGEDSGGLGRLLMRNFLFTLLETDAVPERILLLNTGVLLAVQGAESVEALKHLEDQGVEVFSCGICLEHFRKKEHLAVGLVTNMFSTAEHLLAATSVIKL